MAGADADPDADPDADALSSGRGVKSVKGSSEAVAA